MIGTFITAAQYRNRVEEKALLNARLYARSIAQREQLVRLIAYLDERIAAEKREDIRVLLSNLRNQAAVQVAEFERSVLDLRAASSIADLEASEGVVLLKPHRTSVPADTRSAA